MFSFLIVAVMDWAGQFLHDSEAGLGKYFPARRGSVKKGKKELENSTQDSVTVPESPKP